MKRIWPRGIGGRIALILTAGLMSANAIALLLYRHDRMLTSVNVFALSFAEQVMPLAEILESVPPAGQTALIEALNSPYLQVEPMSALPSSKGPIWRHSSSVEQFVQSRLAVRNGRALSVQVFGFAA